MRQNKKGKRIQLYEATEETIEAKESDEEIHKKLDHDLSKLIIQSGNDVSVKKKKKKISYPSIKFGLSDKQVQEIQKLPGLLRPIQVFRKLLNHQFELNSAFVKQQPLFEPFIKQFHKTVLNSISEIQTQRILHVEMISKDYVRPQSDQIQIKKGETLTAIIRKLNKIKVVKSKLKQRARRSSMHGRASMLNKKTAESQISNILAEIIQHLALTVDINQIEDQIRKMTEQMSHGFMYKIRVRKESICRASRQIKQNIDKILKLERSVREIYERVNILRKYHNKQKTTEYTLFNQTFAYEAIS